MLAPIMPWYCVVQSPWLVSIVCMNSFYLDFIFKARFRLSFCCISRTVLASKSFSNSISRKNQWQLVLSVVIFHSPFVMWHETRTVLVSADSRVVRISPTLMSGLTGISRVLWHSVLMSVSLSTGVWASEAIEMAAHDTRQITWAALNIQWRRHH